MTDQFATSAPERSWYVYMLRCSDNSLYTGVTTDLERREAEHNAPASVTRYTRVRRPVRIVYAEPAENRSQACRREHSIKSLSKRCKEALIRTDRNLICRNR